MKSIIVWFARAVLVGILLLATTIAFDANRSVQAFVLAPDGVQHGLFAYGLTVLSVLSFPRLHPLLPGTILVILGGVLEGLQGLGLAPGGPQLSDWIADLAGVSAALVPLFVAEARRRLKFHNASAKDRLEDEPIP